MMRSSLLALLAAAALACRPSAPSVSTSVDRTPAIAPRRDVNFPAQWRFDAGREAAFAERSMIASNDSLASAAGNEILRRGGNAVDAAVAVGFALAVTYPEAGNIGGGGYMVIRMADGRAAALDYREMAPGASHRNMYLDASGKLTDESVVGYKASGVPGAVAGLTAALERFGSLPLADVMAPAIRLAEDGFVVDSALSASIARNRELIEQFDGARVFVPNGTPIAVGTRLRQPALARTLRRIAARGADGFYRGEVADSIAAGMQRGGGIITMADLARYQAEWREPIRSSYRGHTLLSMPPSSSGGVTVTETLNILETFDSLPAHGSARYSHFLAAALQRAFIDRNAKLGDPAFVQVPLAQLTSKEYARRLRATIDLERATPTREVERAIAEGTQTTHYSVVDGSGNAVATTTTINNLYGSGVYLASVGFFMNDEMDDFAAQPGKPNMFGLVQGEQNAIAPGKRMLSAMSPTIVLDPAGELLLVVGGRGGPRIISAVTQVILNVIDHRMSLADAVLAPRLHHQALPDTIRIEANGARPSTVDSLRAMGYGVTLGGTLASVNAVMRTRGGWSGVSDPRSEGASGAVGH
jgi:gamma-glutamyltranspeptidase/glutathione hydrolase